MSSENEKNLVPVDIDKVLNEDMVERHSYFQLKYFVIGKEPTNQSKMWRCLTELKARRESIEDINMEIEDTQDDLDSTSTTRSEFGFDLNPNDSRINERKRLRRKKQLEKRLESLNRKLKNVQQEATFFEQAFRSLEKIEPLKPYDDFQSQTQYWNEKLLEELNLKMLLHQPIDTEVVKTIMTLDGETPVKKTMVKVFQSINEQAKQLEEKKKRIE